MEVMEKRDKSRYGECVIRSAITEEQWLGSPPSADAARPPSCPRCREAAWRGARLRIVSHGRRAKSQLGPKDPSHVTVSPLGRVVVARRYRCAVGGCGAVMLVGPSSVAPRLHYSACAVALALSLWAKGDGEGAGGGESSGKPGRPALSKGEGSRRQIDRWLKATRQRRVFRGLSCAVRAADSILAQAQAVVQCLAGWAPARVGHTSLVVQAFHGAAQLP